MQKIFSKQNLVGVVCGALTACILQPLLAIPLLIVSVLFPIPGREYLILFLTFLIAGIVTGSIVKDKNRAWMYAAFAAFLASLVFIIVEIRALSSSPHVSYAAIFSANMRGIIRTIYLTPVVLAIAALGGIVSKSFSKKMLTKEHHKE